MIEELNDEQWNEKVIERKGWVLVDFWRPECGPCRMLSVVLQDIDSRDSILERPVFAKVNTNESRKLARSLDIRMLPTLILFKDGVEVERKIGLMTATMLRTWFRRKMSDEDSVPEKI